MSPTMERKSLIAFSFVSALIVTPAAAAFQLTNDFKKMMILSILLGIASTWIGLFLSSLLDIASGATIVITATIIFFLCSFLSPHRKSLRKRMVMLKKNIER